MASKFIAVALTIALAVSCTAGSRTLLVTSSAPAPAPAVESAPAPESATAALAAPASGPAAAAPDVAAAAPVTSQTPPPAGCALSYVQGNGSYSMFNNILSAAPQSANFSNILADQSQGITLFLPDNRAVNATLNKYGLDLQGLLQQQSLCEEIINYHILPSPIEMAAFKEGYSFNTLLKGADLRDALRVRKSNNTIKIAGGKTTAAVDGTTVKVCMDSVFHISMLLLPRNSVETTSGNPSS